MIEISVIGETRVMLEHGTTVHDVGGPKPRQLLEILATRLGTPVSKARLADMLWEGEPPRSALGTLEGYVCVLRRTLQLGMGRRSMLATTSAGYLLDPAAVTVDLEQVRGLLQEIHEGQSEARVDGALRLLTWVGQGDLLASTPYAAWAEGERAALARGLRRASHLGAESALALGRYDDAARLAGWGLGRDALDEAAALHLMTALAATGRRCEALRAYLDLRVRLAEELGVEPSPALAEAYLELLRGPGYDAAAGPRVPAQRSVRQGPSGSSASDRAELEAILRALRTALEKVPGIVLPAEDARLADLAVSVLRVA